MRELGPFTIILAISYYLYLYYTRKSGKVKRKAGGKNEYLSFILYIVNNVYCCSRSVLL